MGKPDFLDGGGSKQQSPIALMVRYTFILSRQSVSESRVGKTVDWTIDVVPPSCIHICLYIRFFAQPPHHDQPIGGIR